jgi:hypothetical protein
MKYERPGECLAFSCSVSQEGNHSESLTAVIFVRRKPDEVRIQEP